jgi:hypothetical protein
VALKRTWGLQIAGFGDPVTGEPVRIALMSTTLAGGEIYFPLAAGPLSKVAQRVKILEGSTTQSSISLQVAGLDTSFIGRQLRSFLCASRPKPWGYITADRSAVATSFAVTRLPPETVPAVHDTVYLEREALRVLSVTPLGGNDYTIVMSRGMYGTTAVAHKTGAFADDSLYKINPIREGREVTLYHLNRSTGVETKRWQGLLERPPSNLNLTGMRISARNVWAYIGKRQLGKGRLRTEMRIAQAERDDPSRVIVYQERQDVVSDVPVLADGTRVVMHIDGWVIPVTLDEQEDVRGGTLITLGHSEPDDNGFGYKALHRTDLTADQVAGFLEVPAQLSEAVEVLTTDDVAGFSHFTDENGVPSAHPLDIIRCLMTSTGAATWSTGGVRVAGPNGDFDRLPRGWGAEIPDALIDHTAINALRDSSLFSGLRMRNMVIGRPDGEKKTLKLIFSILKSIFCFPSVSSTGQASFATILDPGSQEVDATIANSDILSGPFPVKLASRFPPIADLVVNAARIGLSDRFQDILDQTDFEQKNRKRYIHSVTDDSIDAGAMGPAGGIDGLGSWQRGLLNDLFGLRYLLQQDELPEYRLEVGPGAVQLQPGHVIDLSIWGMFNADGGRNIASHRCVVVEQAEDPDSFEQAIQVIDLFPMTRAEQVVAPSWRITAVASDTEFTVAAAEFSDDDRALLAVGRRIELYDRTGVLRSVDAYRTVNTYTPGTGVVILDAAWESGAVAVTPAVGDVVRLVRYDDRDAYAILRAYMADAAAELGAAQDPAHNWGY